MKRIILSIIVVTSLNAKYIRDNTKETVNNINSGLLIGQDYNNTKLVKKSWKDAIDYCENLNEFDDLRLSNFNKLYKIVNKIKYNPSQSYIDLSATTYMNLYRLCSSCGFQQWLCLVVLPLGL
jgi:predicted membrane protein